MKKGDVKAYRSDNLVIVAWKDKRPVLTCSTYHGDEMVPIERKKAGGSVETVEKPVVTADYTAKMGGVDRADHYCASYNFSRKSLKWWRKLFFWILEVRFYLYPN